jgi:IS5 family transposase
MHSVAKGNQWFFGMRCHIGVDAASGLVHSVVSTAANVHELNTAAERLHGEEKVVYGGLPEKVRARSSCQRAKLEWARDWPFMRG